ncbi:hypothetical protein [Aquiflexum lacus]|uniref:hypothetical protein n=1 Tax=Aquiflexum lacus TaxID=2483805 RepID=UPI001895EB94|nr:hypothetical protein [Aquiflexum lacus]
MKKINSNTSYNVARIILAVIFIPSSFISFFLKPSEMGIGIEAANIVENLWSTGYLMHVVKLIELIAGIMFLINRYVVLAIILITPVIVNILLLAIFKDISGLTMGILLCGLISIIAYHKRYNLIGLLNKR